MADLTPEPGNGIHVEGVQGQTQNPHNSPITTVADLTPEERWLMPRDGGRGREIRGRWTVLRFFSWRFGSFYRRWRRWYTHLTWHVLSMRNLLLGVWAYRDDDGDWNVEVGLGPLLHLHLLVADWPRPKDGSL